MKELKVFPISFTEPTDERIVVIEQVHHEQLSDKVKQRWVSLTIQQDGENVVVPIATKNGAKSADSQLTLSVSEARRLIQFLAKAVEDAEIWAANK
jgi:Cdc6-like AAA superfamily ATPase